MEGDFVCVRVQACGVVRARLVKEQKVEYCGGNNHKREEEVKGKEAG